MRYRFGSFELNTAARQLRTGDEEVAVEPQVFDLLRYLVEHRDRMVTKDELFEHIWNGRMVSDATLSSRVKDVRQAIGDDGERQAWIKTLRGRGFQFVGEIESLEDESEIAGSGLPNRPIGKRTATIIGGGLLIAIVIAGSIALWQTRSHPADNTIAVMAFADMSEAKDQAYFADGIAEEILNSLVKSGGLQVVGRTSSFSFKGQNADLKAIGEQLGVSSILEGSVRRDGDRLRITAQLVQVADGYHLWSESYDRTLTNIFDVQNDIARSVVKALQQVLNPQLKARPLNVVADTIEPEAYRLYLQGRWLIRNRTRKRVARAIDILKQVIAREPDYAPAYSGLAIAEVLYPAFKTDWDPTAELAARPRAIVWAEKALALDPSLSEPHAALALSYGREWQWTRSRHLLEKALRTDPSDTTARMWYGVLLYVTGHVEAGLDQLDVAAARDPVYPTLMRIRAGALSTLGREQEAIEAAQLAIALGSHGGHVTLGHIAKYNGDLDRALEHYTAHWQRVYKSPEKVAIRRELFEKLVDPQRDVVERVREIDRLVASGYLPKNITMFLYLQAGDAERAMKRYEDRITGSRVFLSTLWRAEYQHARQHPYFSTFVKNLGLLDYWKTFGFPEHCRPKGDDGVECD